MLKIPCDKDVSKTIIKLTPMTNKVTTYPVVVWALVSASVPLELKDNVAKTFNASIDWKQRFFHLFYSNQIHYFRFVLEKRNLHESIHLL